MRFDSRAIFLKQCHFHWGREEFLWVPSPDCNTAELCNECFSLFMLSSFLKARADTLPEEAKQWKIFGTMRLLRQKWQILKITLPQKNCHRILTPSSKLMILVSFCWKKEFYTQQCTQIVFSVPCLLKIIDRRCCILSGPPCIYEFLYIFMIQIIRPTSNCSHMLSTILIMWRFSLHTSIHVPHCWHTDSMSSEPVENGLILL